MEKMNIVIVGHVDHGKSTLVGRLLADTNSLPEGKLQKVKDDCKSKSKRFEYAFLIDALKDEWSQGITIDVARIFFKSAKRKYIILDAPGHIEFLKNMVTGASHAEAAVLVIDANEGVQENSKRHGYMLSMLGVKKITVAVNKMDLINYDQDRFIQIKQEYTDFLKEIGVSEPDFIPVSGFMGDNITESSTNIPWYEGDTLLQHLDHFKKEPPAINQSFRMFLQDVYKFTALGDDRRLFVGSIETGTISEGDEITFYPSNKTSRIKLFEFFSAPHKSTMTAGNHVAFTLEEEVHVPRGALIASVKEDSDPIVSSSFQASIFWLGKQPLQKSKVYFIKIGNKKTRLSLEEIHKVINASNLDLKQEIDQVERHEVARCTFSSNSEISFDLEIPQTNRFVIIDDYEISGGGIILENVDVPLNYKKEIFLSMAYYNRMNDRVENVRPFRKTKPFVLILNIPIFTLEESGADDLRGISKPDSKKDQYMNLLTAVRDDLIEKYAVSHDLYFYQLKAPSIDNDVMITSALLDAGKNVVLSIPDLTEDKLKGYQNEFDCNVLDFMISAKNLETELKGEYFIKSTFDSAVQENFQDIIDLLQKQGVLS